MGQPIVAVGGSVIGTVTQVTRLAWHPKAQGKSLSAYRLHTHFEGVTTRIDMTGAKPKEEAGACPILALFR